MLVNKELDYRGCWPGACEPINYSLDKYVAVNVNSFKELRAKLRPPEEECGPRPLCPSHIVNDNFVAKCIDNTCMKVSKTWI